jgi:AraC family transcriptional regulator
LRGSFAEVFGSSTVHCSAPSVLFKPAGAEHADHYGAAGADCLVVELPESRLRALPPRVLSNVSHLANGAVGALVHSLAIEVRAADELSALAIEGLVLELLAQIGRQTAPAPPPHAPPWLPAVRNLLRTRCREPLSMAEIAGVAGVDPSHLAKVFRFQEGMTPSEFVRAQRVEWTRWRLLRSDDSLAAIALEAGFADQSHFTRSFRRVTGISPGRYRRFASRSDIDSVPTPD